MRLIILFACICTPVLLFAQRNFQHGRVVNLKGDTLNGFIDYQEWSANPQSILFKSSANDEAKSLGIDNITYFEVSDKEKYQRYGVKISLDPTALNDIQTKDTTYKNDTVFLKIVSTGKIINILSYADKIKERFYGLEQGSTQPVELIYRQYFVGDDRSTLVTNDVYRGQLTNIMYNRNLFSEQLVSDIHNTEYVEIDMRKIAGKINGVNKHDAKLAEKNKSKGTRFFAGVGVQKNEVTFAGDNFFASHSSCESSLLPAVSAGIDIFVNPNVRKLLFRGEVGFHSNKATVTGSSGNNTRSVYNIAMSAFTLQPQIIFNIFNSPNFKIPVGVGMSLNATSYSENVLREYFINPPLDGPRKNNPYKLEKATGGFIVRAGLVVLDRFEASVLYQPPASITTYTNFTVRNSIRQVNVTWLFGKTNTKPKT